MMHVDIVELVDLYVLDALPSDLAEEVEAHLAECSECQALAGRSWEVARLLRAAAPEVDLSPSLRVRLMDVVTAETRRSPLRLVRAEPVRRPASFWSTARRWAGAAAIVPLLLASWLTIQVVSLQQQMHTNELALVKSWQTGRDATEIMAKAMERGGGFVRVIGAEMAPAASGMLYYGRNENLGVLVVVGLPPLPPDQVYQCWFVSGDKRMSGGMFKLEEDGRGMLVVKSPMALDSVDLMRVTIEPSGGSGEPRGSPYLWARIKGT
jgi:anti-sigma-K factor RskA